MLEQSKTTSKIDEAIFDVQAKAPVIKKKSENDYYRSKYAEYPDIQAAVKPLLTEAKIQVKSFPVEGNKLVFILTHLPSQEYYRATIDLNSINVSPQAQGSAITYMKRYALVAALDLIIEGDDDDGNSSSNTKPKQQAGQQASQQPMAAEDKRAWLNPNSQTWFDAKLWVFNSKGTLDKVNKKYRISKDNAVILMQPEDLKPGNKLWDIAAKHLSKENSKAVDLVAAFNITDSDLQDLQVDALNLTDAAPAAETKAETTESKTTK